MATATLTFYPDYPGDSTSEYASAAVDTLNNDVEPQLEMDTNIFATEGRTVDDWVNGDWENFLDWLEQNNLNDDDGELHVYVVDDPFGGNSFAGGDKLKSTNDAYAYWNAGKGNLNGDNFNINIAIQESFHTSMYESQCPGDNYDNSDDHTCGEIRHNTGDGYDDVTPMITSYAGEVGDSCNGNTNGTYLEYVQDLSYCTEENVEDWLDSNF
jgi:hypothetical protein